MTRTEGGTQLEVGESVPGFELENTDGETVSLNDLDNFDGVLVVFMCNHCPFVQGQAEELKRLDEEFSSIAVVGINPNVETHPMDSAEKMPEFLKEYGLDEKEFYYLQDPDQEVAEAFGAQCTPDSFLLDMRHNLYAHGKLTDREGPSGEIEENYMQESIENMLKRKSPPEIPEPVGCSIKWKE